MPTPLHRAEWAYFFSETAEKGSDMKRIFLMAFLAAGLYASALTVTVEQGSTQTDPINTLPIVFDVVFSDSVSDFAIEDVTWNGTATGITANVAGSGTTYTINVTVSGDGTLIPSLAAEVAQDGSANLNEASTSTDNSVTYDSTDPTVTIEQGSEQDDPAVSLPVTFDITFDEPVTGFATGDITMGGTATSPVYAVTGSGATYTLTVSDATLGGTLIPSIEASKCTDLAGNDNEASDSTDNTVSCMTLAGFIELFAAIQAKTDNLPASPAAVGSAMTLTSAYDAAKTAAQAATALSNNTWTDTKAGYIDAKISSRFTTTAIEAPGQISSSYGGGTYTFLDPGTSAGISGGLVQIYSATAYAAGSRTVLASCLTNSDGSWGPVNVLPGSGNLTVVISKTGEITQVKSITVSE